MSVERNIATVKELYGHFTRGEIDAILALLSEDVSWREFAHPDVPYAKTWRGRTAVKDFFTHVGKVEVSKFDIREYLGQGDKVAAIGNWSGRVRDTGKHFDSEWIMLWTFAKDGHVSAFFAYEDMSAVAEAFRN